MDSGRGTRWWLQPRAPRSARRARALPAADTSRHPPEPDRGQAGADQQQHGGAACEQIGDLARLLLVAEPRAEVLVDLAQLLVAGGSEELRVGGAGDQLEGLWAGRHSDRLRVPTGELVMHDAVGRTHE